MKTIFNIFSFMAPFLLVRKALAVVAPPAAVPNYGQNIVNQLAPSGGNVEIFSLSMNILNSLVGVVTILAVIAIVYAGIQYATAGGDSGKSEKAKTTLILAIVGIVLAVAAFAVINLTVNAGRNFVSYSPLVEKAEAITLRDIIGYPENWTDVSGLPNQLRTGNWGNASATITPASPLGRFMTFLLMAAFGGLIYASFLYVTSYGDNSKAEKAKKMIIFAVSGILLLVVGWAIISYSLGRLANDQVVY